MTAAQRPRQLHLVPMRPHLEVVPPKPGPSALAAAERDLAEALDWPDILLTKTAAWRSSELSSRVNGPQQLAAWQAGESDVLVTQVQSGSVGVDMTQARYAVYYSLSWSLGEYEQSLARLHRPGQTRGVTYVHLVAAGTVDEAVWAALERRQEVVEAVLDTMRQRRAPRVSGV